jgi:hypothetical protein
VAGRLGVLVPWSLAPEEVPPEEAILDTATDAKGFTVILGRKK